MALVANSFSNTCAVALSTNLKRCGTITLCSAKPLTPENLTDAYMESGNYRLMSAIFAHDIEIKMCGQQDEGLYEFFMANKVDMRRKMQMVSRNRGIIDIKPFVEALQRSPINNQNWRLYNATQDGYTVEVDVTSPGGIPLDVTWFNVGIRVNIDGQNGTTATHTQWTVTEATITTATIDGVASTPVIHLVLEDQNQGSNLPADKLAWPPDEAPDPATGPVGILLLNNKNLPDAESDCSELPGVNNKKLVQFWTETIRNLTCKSELFDKFKKAVSQDNALFAEFGDIDEVELTAQQGAEFKRRMVNNIFWGKALNANQTWNGFNDLPQILSPVSPYLETGGAKCMGRQANAIGIYEQLYACERVYDVQGGAVSLTSLFLSFYRMWRVKKSAGAPDKAALQFDVFTDMLTARAINVGMLGYYKQFSQEMLRFVQDASAKPADWGFFFKSYPLEYPVGATMNVVTHPAFDDYLTANTNADQPDVGRVLWVLDFSGIYVGIVATNRKAFTVGQLETLAKIDRTWACAMASPTQEINATSITYTVVVECPKAHVILENLGDEAFTFVEDAADIYP